MKATFEADFSTFRSEVDKSIVTMKGFESESKAVSDSLSKMVDQFSGRAVIEQATLMARAVEQIGGASKLSQTELAQLAQVTGAAADKFLAFGQEVPANLQKTLTEIRNVKEAMAAAEREVASWEPIVVKNGAATDKLGRSFSVLSETMSLVGVSGGSTFVAELGNLTQMATGAAGAVGTLGTALAGIGVVITGAKIGAWLGEWAKTETVIPNFTAKILGWGDAAAQAAGAGADVLARASATAGREITNMTEAMRINEEQAKKNQDAWRQTFLAPQEAWNEFIRSSRATEAELAANERKYIESVKRMMEEAKKGMQEYEAEELKAHDIGLKLWTDGNKLLDEQNKKMQDRLALQTAYVTQLILERDKARDANRESSLGPAYSDTATAAAATRDRALADIEAQRQRAPNFDFGDQIKKIWDDFDKVILHMNQQVAAAPGAAGGIAPITIKPIGPSTVGGVQTVNVQVSGVIDTGSSQALTEWFSKMAKGLKQWQNA